ncbi:MAG: PEP-CTERM sorting domain-containing protein [Thermodesulfobacteriota bacterium]
MVKKLLIIVVSFALVLCFSVFSSAGPINPLFEPAVLGGLERLEFRTGKDGARDWEIGLGNNTQKAGQFAAASVLDDTWWTVGEVYNFTYAIDSSGVGRFSLYGSDKQLEANLEWGSTTGTPLLLGNTLQIHAKRDVDITFGGVSLSGDAGDPWGLDYGYISIDPINGFSLEGTIMFRALGTSGSWQGVTITVGHVAAPVPEPATMLLLGSGLLGLAGLRKKFKK